MRCINVFDGVAHVYLLYLYCPCIDAMYRAQQLAVAVPASNTYSTGTSDLRASPPTGTLASVH